MYIYLIGAFLTEKQIDNILERKYKKLNDWLKIQNTSLDEKEQQEINDLSEKIKALKKPKWEKIHLTTVIDYITSRYSQINVW